MIRCTVQKGLATWLHSFCKVLLHKTVLRTVKFLGYFLLYCLRLKGQRVRPGLSAMHPKSCR